MFTKRHYIKGIKIKFGTHLSYVPNLFFAKKPNKVQNKLKFLNGIARYLGVSFKRI
jgi:hypothetical protein